MKGIGEKGAKALIEQWGTIEEMLDHLEEITPQRAQKALAAAQEKARHYKHLATIVTDVPEAVLDLDAARVHEYDRGEVLQLFQELEFRSLVARLPQHADMAGAPESAEHAEGAITRGGDYELVTTPQRLAEVVEAVQAARRFGFEVVADDEHPMRAGVLPGGRRAQHRGRPGLVPAVRPHAGGAAAAGGAAGAGPDRPRTGARTVRAGRTGRALRTARSRRRRSSSWRARPSSRRSRRCSPTRRSSPSPTAARTRMLALGAAPDGFWTQAINFDTSIAGYVLGERAVDVRGLAFERLGHELVEPKSLLGTGRKAIPFSRSAPGDAKEARRRQRRRHAAPRRRPGAGAGDDAARPRVRGDRHPAHPGARAHGAARPGDRPRGARDPRGGAGHGRRGGGARGLRGGGARDPDRLAAAALAGVVRGTGAAEVAQDRDRLDDGRERPRAAARGAPGRPRRCCAGGS